MEYTMFTVAIILVCDGKFWMSQRVNTRNFAGKWQFPGGKLEENENPIDGALRELREETGLNIDINRLRFIGPITGDPTTRICFTYSVSLNETEIPQHTENTMTDWRLLTANEALILDLMPGLQQIIETFETL